MTEKDQLIGVYKQGIKELSYLLSLENKKPLEKVLLRNTIQFYEREIESLKSK